MPRMKSHTSSIEYTCPQCSAVRTIEYHYSAGCSERGEWMFSLGTPEEPPEVEADGYTCECGEVITDKDIEQKVFKTLEDE